MAHDAKIKAVMEALDRMPDSQQMREIMRSAVTAKRYNGQEEQFSPAPLAQAAGARPNLINPKAVRVLTSKLVKAVEFST
eukprot:6478995-Amphidinium_carterae.1